jgi:hypothetical protein
MKLRILLTCVLVCAVGSAASAQTKTSGTINCAKPDPAYSIEVGDRTGHSLALSKTACTWTKPMEIAGSQTKDGYDVASADANGMKARGTGYHVSNMSNGDKIFVRFSGTDTMTKDGKPESSAGTWSYTGGTGKLKGIKGKGTYKGKGNADGSITFEVEGEYELPKK